MAMDHNDSWPFTLDRNRYMYIMNIVLFNDIIGKYSL